MRAWLATSVAAIVLASPWTMAALAERSSARQELERLTVVSDGHPLTVWARRPVAPRQAILLVHGRTWSSVPDFDLHVPGLQRSVLVSLAAHGIAAYAVDLRGYGATPRDETGWLTPSRAADDLAHVLRWTMAQHPDLQAPAVVGWSRGAAYAMLTAQRRPALISSVVVYGFAFDPELSFGDAPPTSRPLRIRNTAAAASADFISPKVTPQAVVNAFVAQAVKSDPVLMDVYGDEDFNEIDAARFTTPTLVLYGERDLSVPPELARKMASRLRTTDKQVVMLRGADHAAHLEDTHEQWIAAVVNFTVRTRPR